VILTARYHSVADLAVDAREQLQRGGLLIKTEPPPGLELFAAVQVAVECEAAAVVVSAQVLHIFPGLGVAVGLDADARARIDALIAGDGDPPAHRFERPDTEPTGEPGLDGPDPDEPDTDPGAEPRIAGGSGPITPAGLADDDPATAAPARRPMASTNEKIQQALHGDRDARFAVMRDRNRNLHAYLLRNPGITLDEIAAMARMATTSVDALRQIAERREWGHRPEIAIALLRNPGVPPPLAIPLLEFVSPVDLKQLAKDTRTRDPIQRAARKKLLG